MARNKVRFVATIDGARRDLFAVGETNTGDLTIIRRAERSALTPSLGTEAIKEHRVSIHRSLASKVGGTTIMQTTTVVSGSQDRGAAFVQNGEHPLMWPIYAVLCPDLRHDIYKPSLKNTSAVVNIAIDCPPEASLMYHVFVAAADYTPPNVAFCSLYVHRFEHFKLAVYVNYMNMPSSALGITSSIYTSPERRDGVEQASKIDFERFFPRGAVALEAAEVAHLIWSQCDGMWMSFARLVTKGRDDKLLKGYEVLFSQFPANVGQVLKGKTPDAPWQPRQP